MEAKKYSLLRMGDVVVILAVVIVALGLLWAFLSAEEGNVATVTVHGETVLTLPLDKNAEYEIQAGEHTLIVAVEDGSVCVRAADCPDQVCRQTGKISKAGASIACAPAKVLIRISGGGATDVDHVAG